ncbi:lycopene cyclase family protein [Flaviaesturariibacter amylovorans]|uniref:Lycopene cyclase family protein n=1 Tax=Flaviaesturariibacter amylovorans TaxID=1084520 RepID=A0ABP8GBX0_9BACT
MPDEYDYIIAGGGCAGLSLLQALIRAGVAEGARILVVDRDAKEANDRTWCFWEAGEGPFESIVHKEWAQLDFHSDHLSRRLDIAPYRYKLIRGIDFYRHCHAEASRMPGIQFLQESVSEVFTDRQGAGVRAGGRTYRARYVFSSLYERPEPRPGKHWLLQHFTGWVIETEAPAFDPAVATFMDFRTDQQEGTTFFYVLPLSPTRALVEYTLFTGELLSTAAYEEALGGYIRERLGIGAYTVAEREFGIIPMTNHRFPARNGNVVYIGTAGGQTKASSGYTFRNVQKHSAALAESLKKEGHPFAVDATARRFGFYDSVLLDILAHRSLEGADIFTDLFRGNRAASVFRFLDNESALHQELRLISTLPTLPFSRAALRQLRP